jgi:hypothetical protein
MAEGLGVDANLVSAAGFDADFDEGEGAIGGDEAFENMEVGDGGAAVGAAGGHASAADEVAGDGEGDGGVVFFEVAMDEGEVGLRDLTLGEHVAEFAVGAVVFGDEDEAAGLLVETMDDAGAEVATYVGEFVEVEEERVDEGALVALVYAIGWARAGTGVDHHAGGFVDDGEVFVFVKDVERDVFGDGVKGCGLRGAFDFDGLAAAEFLFGLGRVAVDADLTGFDEELDAGSADVGEGVGEILVEAEVGGGGVGDERTDACLRVFFEVFEVDDGDWGWKSFFDAAGGAVFGFDGAAALALGEHVLRRHGRPAFGVAGEG